MVDDFHGSREWDQFVDGMRRVFPDRPIVDLDDDDPIFHTFWDLEEREQIPGAQFLYYGRATRRTATSRTGAASTTTKGA